MVVSWMCSRAYSGGCGVVMCDGCGGVAVVVGVVRLIWWQVKWMWNSHGQGGGGCSGRGRGGKLVM